MANFKHFILLMLTVFKVSEAARILVVVPTPSISHQVVFRPLTQELAKRGHQVVVITPNPVFSKGESPANLTEIDVHDISYNTWKQMMSTIQTDKSDITNQFRLGLTTLANIFAAQLKTEEVRKLIENKDTKFDLLIIELCARTPLILSHVFKVPVIQMSSVGGSSGTYEIMGAATHPILYPLCFRRRLYNLTVWEKVTELYNANANDELFENLEEYENQMMRSYFGPNIPTLSELKVNIHMQFLNSHRIWDDNRPVPPGIIYIGGLHRNPENTLPKDLETYLNSSKNGVIYISFGSNVVPSMLPSEKTQLMVKVLSQLPYNVLWKWDEEELSGKAENIRTGKWFPQSDLLKHPSIKLFITQGGMQSTEEAIDARVPLLGIPIVADQWFNTEKYVKHRIGKQLDLMTMTEEEFKSAVITIIQDDSYRINVARLRSLMYDQPQTPLERAVWWTEHLLRHGGATHLRAPAANMSWTEYLMMDVLLTVLGIIAVIILSVICIIYYIWILFKSSVSTTVKVKSS